MPFYKTGYFNEEAYCTEPFPRLVFHGFSHFTNLLIKLMNLTVSSFIYVLALFTELFTIKFITCYIPRQNISVEGHFKVSFLNEIITKVNVKLNKVGVILFRHLPFNAGTCYIIYQYRMFSSFIRYCLKVNVKCDQIKVLLSGHSQSL